MTKSIFIGAHPDDVVIGAGNFIKNMNEFNETNFYILLTNGATSFSQDYPVVISDSQIYHNPKEYSFQRLREDEEAIKKLGISSSRVFRFGLNDQETYKNIPFIVSELERIISEINPDRIFTHSFPEAHPDHEIACFCTHYALSRLKKSDDIDVFEYPQYIINETGERINRTFLDLKDVVEFKLEPTEIDFKKKLFLIYDSQPDLIERYLTDNEQFRLTKRSVNEFNEYSDYISPWIRELKPYILKNEIESFLRYENEK